MATAQSTVELIIRAKAEGEDAIRKIAPAANEAVAAVKKLAATNFDFIEKEANEASSRVNSIGVASIRAKAALKKLDRSRLKQLRSDVNATSNGLKSLARSVGGILATLGAGLGIGFITQEINEFSLAVAEVSTLVDSTVRSTAQLREDVRLTAAELGTGSAETARALYDIISAGAEAGADANRLLADSIVLATAGITEAQIAADLLTTVINSYGFAAEDATRISDILFTTVELGKTKIEELAASFSTIAPVASNAGIRLEEITAATATLTAQGITTSEAMTGLRGAIVGLTKTTAAQDAIKELGFASFSAASRAIGFQKALQLVIDSAGGSEAQLLKLFGRVEGLNAALSLTGRNTERFNENLERIENSAGAAARAADKIRESAGRQFAEAINRLKDSFLILEPVIQDIATQILPQIGAAFGTVSELIADNRGLVILLTEALLALATVGIAANILGILVPLGKFKKAADIAVKAANSLGNKLNYAPLLNLSTKAAVLFTAKLALAAAVAVGIGLVFKSWLEGLNEAEFAAQRAKERLDELNQAAEIGKKQLEALGDVKILTPEQLGTLAFEEAIVTLEDYEKQLEAVLSAERIAAANLTGGPEFDASQERIQELLVSLEVVNDALLQTGRTLIELPQQAEGFVSALETEVQGVRDAIKAANDGFISLDLLLATLSTRTVSAAENIKQEFISAKQSGELLSDTADDILKEFLKLNNLDLEALESIFRGVTKVGKEESAALFTAYEQRLEKLSDEELQQFLEIAQKTFKGVSDSAITESAIVAEAFGRALDTLGIDFGLATQNIRDDILDLGEQFATLADRFADAGTAVDQQARAVAQAISNLRLQSAEEFLELRQQLKEAFGEDFLDLGPIKKALEDLVPPIKEVEKSAAAANVTTKDWNNSVGNLSKGLNTASDATKGLKQDTDELAGSMEIARRATEDVDTSLDGTISDLQAAGASMDELNRAAKRLADEQRKLNLPGGGGGQTPEVERSTTSVKKNTQAKKENTQATREGDAAQQKANEGIGANAALQTRLIENFAAIRDSGGNAARRLEELQRVIGTLAGQSVSVLIEKVNILNNSLVTAAVNAKQAFADAEAGIIPMAAAIARARLQAQFLDAETLAKITREAEKLRATFNQVSDSAAQAAAASRIDLAEAQGDEEGVLRAQSAAKILELEEQRRAALQANNTAAALSLRKTIEQERFALSERINNLRRIENEERNARKRSTQEKSIVLETETQAKFGALRAVGDEEVRIAEKTMQRIKALSQRPTIAAPSVSIPGRATTQGGSILQQQAGAAQQALAPVIDNSVTFNLDGDKFTEENIRRKILPLIQQVQGRRIR